jgi:hypothetical protein
MNSGSERAERSPNGDVRHQHHQGGHQRARQRADDDAIGRRAIQTRRSACTQRPNFGIADRRGPIRRMTSGKRRRAKNQRADKLKGDGERPSLLQQVASGTANAGPTVADSEMLITCRPRNPGRPVTGRKVVPPMFVPFLTWTQNAQARPQGRAMPETEAFMAALTLEERKINARERDRCHRHPASEASATTRRERSEPPTNQTNCQHGGTIEVGKNEP